MSLLNGFSLCKVGINDKIDEYCEVVLGIYMSSLCNCCEIKFWILVYVENDYCHNASPYYGKEEDKETTYLVTVYIRRDNSSRWNVSPE